MLHKKILEHVKMRLWAASQFPDVERLHAHGGIGAVTAYLKQCASPTITRDTLARFGATIHRDCQPVGPWITMHEAPNGYANLRVGAHCHIGKEVFLDLTERITLADGAGLGMRCIVLTHLNFDANPERPLAAMWPTHAKPTTLERGAMVGAGTILLAGVTVGAHAVVGAGCVVSEDVPPCTVMKSPGPVEAYRVPETILRKLQARVASDAA
jgi:acetyltransferase-like isoleucine patch superfamily enzyme